MSKVSDEDELKIYWESNELASLESRIRKMSKSKKTKKKEVSTKSKCSFYKCTNVEKHPREFKICTRCHVATYCSKKCQKEDWKAGHKRICE
jgi:hypothetical protein